MRKIPSRIRYHLSRIFPKKREGASISITGIVRNNNWEEMVIEGRKFYEGRLEAYVHRSRDIKKQTHWNMSTVELMKSDYRRYLRENAFLIELGKVLKAKKENKRNERRDSRVHT
jgi:hypothetical protein